MSRIREETTFPLHLSGFAPQRADTADCEFGQTGYEVPYGDLASRCQEL